ncbi:MAG: sulfatase-like hydrolase/transferase, partial [Planctomycetia bacterium]|nr:sulfatase-like hydrolase/transferase [Planctomycetia bacterium]
MKINFQKSRRLQYLFSIITIYWILFIILRISFYFAYRGVSGDFEFSELVKAFFMGIRFDLRLAILIFLPLIVFSMIPFLNLTSSKIIRRIASIYVIIISIIIILFYVADFGHYGYLDSRIDITAVNFVENPIIALQMIWESYSVIWGLIIIILLVYGLHFCYQKIAQHTIQKVKSNISIWQKTIGSILGSVLLIIGSWGTLSQYALYWSDVQFSRNQFVTSMGLNPVLYFFDTMKFQEQDYDIQKVKSHYEIMTEFLNITDSDINNLNFTRNISSTITDDRNLPNVVIIFLESVGVNRLGTMGNPLNPTPFLDQLIKNSLFFDRFYVPYVSTSRSVFTLITGIPDVARVKTSSRNPMIRNQNTIINDFKNYNKHFIIGGSASWANIRSLITYNIKDIELTELGDFNRPRLDVWGISDLDLFRESHKIFKNESTDKPFFAIIQTASNHRPYSIPKDNEGFEYITMSESELFKSGFKSVEQYNGVRFLDHSLSKFFEMASKEPYYNNTIFVLFGDHGTSDPQAQHMSPADYDLKLRSYNVPLIVYTPGVINQHRIIHKVCGLPDILPTIAGLVGISYTNHTIGRDILNMDNDLNYSLIINTKLSPSSYGIIGKEFYLQKFRD